MLFRSRFTPTQQMDLARKSRRAQHRSEVIWESDTRMDGEWGGGKSRRAQHRARQRAVVPGHVGARPLLANAAEMLLRKADWRPFPTHPSSPSTLRVVGRKTGAGECATQHRDVSYDSERVAPKKVVRCSLQINASNSWAH